MAVGGLARRQHGRVARGQLVAAGVGNSTIGRMLASGWLRREHQGVYALTGAPPTRLGSLMAAALAGGPLALVSHRSAAELWGLLDPIPGPVHVTTPSGGRVRRGIVFHRSGQVPAIRAERHLIPVTSLEQTLIDLAGSVGPGTLRRALEAADAQGLLHVDKLARACSAVGPRRGLGRLRALVDELRPLTETASELERRFQRFCREEGLPAPATNVPVAGFLVDCFWPEHKLVVELDGYAYHRSPRQFERDRRRDARLQLEGNRALRVTSRRLADARGELAAELRRGLGLPS